MPYGYILLIATVVLAVRHVRSTYASKRSKWLVGLAAGSVLALDLGPGLLPLVAMFLQLAVCFYVLFHETVWRPDDKHARASRTLDRTNRSEDASVEDH